MNEKEKTQFIKRCVEALNLTNRVVEALSPTDYPATHPAFAEIFKFAYIQVEKTEVE